MLHVQSGLTTKNLHFYWLWK